MNYEVIRNTYQAKQVLNNLPNVFSADFEVSSRFTDSEKKIFQYRLDHYNLSDEDKRLYKTYIESSGLSHPSLVKVTHLSLGISPSQAYVIVLHSTELRDLCFNFLVTTNKKQLWHNFSYDGSLIFYYTKNIPKNFVDTQLFAKCLLNHTNNAKSLTGLKHLEGDTYGDWGLSKEEFNQSEMDKEYFLRYAATDACATYKLYVDILENI